MQRLMFRGRKARSQAEALGGEVRRFANRPEHPKAGHRQSTYFNRKNNPVNMYLNLPFLAASNDIKGGRLADPRTALLRTVNIRGGIN